MIFYVIRFTMIIVLSLIFFGMAKLADIEPLTLFSMLAFILSLDNYVVRTIAILYIKGLTASDEKSENNGSN